MDVIDDIMLLVDIDKGKFDEDIGDEDDKDSDIGKGKGNDEVLLS